MGIPIPTAALLKSHVLRWWRNDVNDLVICTPNFWHKVIMMS